MKPAWEAGADASTVRLRRLQRAVRRNIPLYFLFVPVIVFFAIFKYAPMFGLVIAFKDYNFADGIMGSPWVGLKHYEMIFGNPQMLQIIRNTLLLSILGIVVGFPVPIALAIMLNEVRRRWFKQWVQTLVYLPHFLNWVIVGGIVITIFSQQSGIVNHWVEKWTGEAFPFLYNETSWVAIFIGSGIWKGAGWGAIIYLAALTAIDPHLYEAAGIDGAGKWRQMVHVTLPGISPTVVLVLILSIGNVMEVGFEQVTNLQNQGVSDVSEVISTYMYKFGLQRAQFSLSTAMGLFESLVGLLLVVTANRIARAYNHELW
ncbi:ABC transporter permease [Paenibacillus flagellatus]|uniref:Protein lplB n=1 Tax=Paenibacillus flagellatus TaxID=2211139 RepID=A0A2V5K4S1_9BACL|nr:ABC transporter permease subunit [Paenibacillus flagellatus]PYI54281.1 protein lplB [Paenibacillus flagellatus]